LFQNVLFNKNNSAAAFVSSVAKYRVSQTVCTFRLLGM
jgi:hypothetical protein